LILPTISPGQNNKYPCAKNLMNAIRQTTHKKSLGSRQNHQLIPKTKKKSSLLLSSMELCCTDENRLSVCDVAMT
jgi:hypothetical protein